MTKSFLSRPTDQAYARDRALDARTTGLGTRMSSSNRADLAHSACDRKHSVCDRQVCPVANHARCCAMFEILFMDTVHRHCSCTLLKKKPPEI